MTAVSSPSTNVGSGAALARTPRQRLMLLGLVVVLLVLARASTAFAGTFVVASCPGDAGWGNASTTASFISYSDDCSNGGTAGIGMTMGPDPYASTYAENTRRQLLLRGALAVLALELHADGERVRWLVLARCRPQQL